MNQDQHKVPSFTLIILVILAVILIVLCSLQARAQQDTGPTNTPQLNTDFYVGSVPGYYGTIQAAVTKACTTAGGRVVIPAGKFPSDSPTTVSGCAQVSIEDRRQSPSSNYLWNPTGSVYQLVQPTASTAVGPAGTPSLCPAGQAARGVGAGFAGAGCFTPSGSGSVDAANQGQIYFQGQPGSVARAQASQVLSPNGNDLVAPGGVTTPNLMHVFNVLAFGAVPDGVIPPTTFGSTATYSGTDNRAAFQNALNAACAAGGGEVYAPAGTYNIVVPVPGAPRLVGNVPNSTLAGLYVNCNNVWFHGAGRTATRLMFWMQVGATKMRVTDQCILNPDSTAPPAGLPFRVWRFPLFVFVGSTNAAAPLANDTLSDIRLTASAVINGNNRNPIWYDNQFPTVAQSICNAWDTSNKGIFFINGPFTQAGFDQGTGYYNGGSYYYDHIDIFNVQVDHVLGEEIYLGNFAHHIRVWNNDLGFTNGDSQSVGGGIDARRNYYHDLSGSATEDTPYSDPMTYIENTVENTKLDGIAVTNLAQWQLQNANYGQITITGNTITNAARTGISAFNSVNTNIQTNTITDSGWLTSGSNTPLGSGIQLYNFANRAPAVWAPSAPAAPALSSGTGGSLSGTYQGSVAWVIAQPSSIVLTAPSAQTQIVVGAGSTITMTQPGSAPANATGWIPLFCSGSAGCTGTMQGGNNILPLTTSTFTQSATLTTNGFPGTCGIPLCPAFTAAIVMSPNATNATVTGNTITADKASIGRGFILTSQGAPLLNPLISNSTLSPNTFQDAKHTQYLPTAAPATAPTLTAVPVPNYGSSVIVAPGTYYVQTKFVSPTCTSAASPEASITIAPGQMFRVSAPTGAASNVIGYYIGVSTTSGAETTQFAGNFQPLGLDYDQASAVTTSSPFQQTTTCKGASLATPMTFPFTAANYMNEAQSMIESGNAGLNSTVSSTQNRSATKAVGTTATTIASLRPWRPRGESIQLYYCVTGAATTLTLNISWIDPQGGSHAPNVVNGTLENVGCHPMPPYPIESGTAVDITVTATAGVAGRITASASINER